MRRREIEWLFSPRGGAAALAPKGFDDFRRHVLPDDPNPTDRAVLDAYYERLSGDDVAVRVGHGHLSGSHRSLQAS